MPGGKVGKEHQQALSLGALRLMRQAEDHFLFLPARNAIGFLLGPDRHGALKVDYDPFGRPRAVGCDKKQQDPLHRGADHGCFISRSDILPVDEANLSASIPIRCSMETNRLGSG